MPSTSEPDPGHPGEERSRRRYVWLALLPTLMAIFFCISSATFVAQSTAPEHVQNASLLAKGRADYGRDPQGLARFAPLNPGIVADIVLDRAWIQITPGARGDTLGVEATAVALLPTASPSPRPTLEEDTPTPTVTPGSSKSIPAGPTATPTGLPVSKATPTPTPVPALPSATATKAPTATPTPSRAPTSTPTPSNTPLPTITPSDTPSPTPVPTDTPTATLPPPPTATPAPSATPTVTPAPLPSSTATSLPTATSSPTVTGTPAATWTPTVTPTPCGGINVPGEPNVGPPNGVFVALACGGRHVENLGTGAIVLPHKGPDLVYYEAGDPGGVITLDWVIIEVRPTSTGAWTVVFNWGDNVPDLNSNVAAYAAGGELDNEAIPTSALFGSPPYQTGIAIDLDPLLPPGTYELVSLTSPAGGDNDGAEVDALQVLP